jgi:hypothetical protein
MCSHTPVSNITLCLQSAQFNCYCSNRNWPNTFHVLQSSEQMTESKSEQEGGWVSSAWTTEETRLDSRPGQEIHLFSRTSRLALESTQPPLQYTWVLSAWVQLSTHLYLMLRLGMSGAIPPFSLIQEIHKGRKQSDWYNLNTNWQKMKDSEERDLLLNCPSAVSKMCRTVCVSCCCWFM